MLLLPLKKISSSKFEQVWGELIHSLRQDSKWSLAYYFIFTHRRIIFCALAFFLNQQPIFQMIGLMVLNYAHSIYIALVKPRNSRRMNRVVLTNEVFIIMATYCMLFFTDWVIEPDDQYFYGFAMNGVVMLCIVFNVAYVLYFGVRSLGLLCKKYYNRFCHWLDKKFPKKAKI